MGRRVAAVVPAVVLALAWVAETAWVRAAPAVPAPAFAVAPSSSDAPGQPEAASGAGPGSAPPAREPQWRQIAGGRLPTDPDRPASHASTLAFVPAREGPGTVVAYWFSGSRESGPDVVILSSRFDLATGRWSPAHTVVERHALGRELGLFVRRLGNPVAWTDADGRVHLFVVATGLGGWAASRIVHLRSHDGGERFEVLRVLPLSPWLNTSHLVRAPATPLADGGALLPIHFEIGIKYPMAVRLSPTGSPIGLTRLSNDTETLQPSIVALDPDRAVALLRDHGPRRRLKLLATGDGGRSWTDHGDAGLPNPDASVVAARLPDGSLVAALNPAQHGRSTLALAVSRDGRHWTPVRTVVSGQAEDEYSYPSLLVVGDTLHLTYTERREAIAHRVFRLGRSGS